MRRREVLDLLTAKLPEIRESFGARSLALFGSYARDEAGPESDVDLLVEFEGPATFLGYIDLIEYLEALTGTRVDFASPAKLEPRIRPYVDRELIRVA